MILMYHKVYPDSPSMWWVTVDDFHRQMCELRSKRVVYLDDYDPGDDSQVVITFDGIYSNVATFASPILRKFGYPFELFVTGDLVGGTNRFDTGEPEAAFASSEELTRLVEAGGRLQWHTRSHPRLDTLTDEGLLRRELTVPEPLAGLDPAGFRWLAYPHGTFREELLPMVRERFAGAVSCIQGNDSDPYRLNRLTVTNETRLTASRTAVLIPSYNYGRYLAEAAESVLRQTRPPDEILILDDASEEDTTGEVGRQLEREHPDLVRYHRNPTNLGIVANFNHGVSLTDADYICILGADNRLRSDYLEKTTAALDRDPRAAVAYTDFAFFGPRARIEYEKIQGKKPWETLHDVYYVVRFPPFDEKARDKIERFNFMHGTSLYRREAFLEVGGYRQPDQGPEDHDLFRRMIRAGWGAHGVPEPLLEYRQHSRAQANMIAVQAHELQFYKKRYLAVRRELDTLTVPRLIQLRIRERRRASWKALKRRLWRLRESLRSRWTSRVARSRSEPGG